MLSKFSVPFTVFVHTVDFEGQDFSLGCVIVEHMIGPCVINWASEIPSVPLKQTHRLLEVEKWERCWRRVPSYRLEASKTQPVAALGLNRVSERGQTNRAFVAFVKRRVEIGLVAAHFETTLVTHSL